MKTKILFILMLLVSSCDKKALESYPKAENGVEVELVVTHNGCNIYRFMDSRYVYFSDCSQNFKQSYTETCGKNCTRTIKRETLGL